MKRHIRTHLCILLAFLLLIPGSYTAGSSAKTKKATLSFKKLTLNEGQSKKIKIKNKNKKAAYKFKSSSKKKVSVSKTGLITAKKSGKATITVTEKLKNKSRKVGVIAVTCKKADTPAPSQEADSSAAPTVTPSATSQNTPQISPEAATTSPDAAATSPEATEASEPTPAPTPDLYTKKVMSIDVTDKKLYTVEGNTCHVDMQYFTAKASGEYFTGNTSGEGTVVIKDYKDGEKKLCSRYILSGTDPDGKKCSIFIEDNGTANEAGELVTKPTILTNSNSLAWLETADIQGRITDKGDGQKTVDIVWNESNTEPVKPPEVVMPDTSQKYPNELFTFTIDIGNSANVAGKTGTATMIHFKGASDCANFKGKVVADSVDTRLKFTGQIETLSARYILSGTDANGNACNIYVENNGIDNNGMVTEPIIISDNPDFAWIESAKLHGTVSWSPKLTIHIATTK